MTEDESAGRRTTTLVDIAAASNAGRGHGQFGRLTMAVRVAVQPKLLRWARERGRMCEDELVKRFPRLREWENKTGRPTFEQLEEYARATRAAFGYFFLAEPPIEQIPIPDFRTVAGGRIERPSPDLAHIVGPVLRRTERGEQRCTCAAAVGSSRALSWKRLPAMREVQRSSRPARDTTI
jgi:hypothetical protein